MRIAMAPMEGLTTYYFRRVFHHHYGGVDDFYTPFLASRKLKGREHNEVSEEFREDMHLIPQILANKPEEFLEIAKQLEQMGYDTVNLNLGCPSGTVVPKKRGSGFLSIPEELDRFLEEIYRRCPLPISIKTRLGIGNTDEWDNLLTIYSRYPIEKLIIHARLQKEFYSGHPHLDCFAAAQEKLSCPLCYNGDITSLEDLQILSLVFPGLEEVMLGRGLIQNPELAEILKSTELPSFEEGGFWGSLYEVQNNLGQSPTIVQDTDRLETYLQEMLDYYTNLMGNEEPILFKLKEMWAFLAGSFPGRDADIKAIRKANSLSAYRIAVKRLLR